MTSETSTPADAGRPTFGYPAALDAVSTWASSMAVAVDSAPLDTPVPTCPGWGLGKLVRHTGRVHRHVTAVVAQQVSEPPGRDLVDFEQPSVDADQAAWIAWFRSGANALMVALADAPSDTPVWSWGHDQTAGFWARRMAHETVIHGVDAHLAVGAPFNIEPALAVDGLDELLEIRRASPAFAQLDAPFAGDGTVHLHATDDSLAAGHGEWMIEFGTDGYEFSHGHGKGDVAVKAPAATLELLVAGRVSADALGEDDAQIFGDRNVLDQFVAGMTFS